MNRLALVITCSFAAISLAFAAPEGVAIDARVRASVVASVESKLGASARVDIASIDASITATASGTLVAVPDPAGRIGRPTRFFITSIGPDGARLRIGQAVAVVNVVAERARVRHAVAAGHPVEPDDVEEATEELKDAPFRHVPTLVDVIGSRATRDLRAGSLVGETDVVVAPAVRAGDRVRATIRLETVVATLDAIAVETGVTGRSIRIVNPQSRRTMFARVTGNGEVEVIHER
jgi:flagella basal body P-ring formation protein FlgA